MTSISPILTILLLIVNSTSLLGQPKQVGIIDFYGTTTNEAELKKCLPFVEDDTVQISTGVKKSIVDCLLGHSKIKQADITFVCCDGNEGKWIVFVGVDTKSKVILQSGKTDDLKLPGEIKSIYDSLMSLIMVAIKNGEPGEDYSSGHSLMTYLPARQLQQKFILYANENLDLLKEVLQKSKYADQRQVAATVIAYYKDKSVIVKDLVNAVSDPDEIVRNNAIRATGIIADYSQTHPDLNINIPAEPFIDMINSISWTDRNKSSFVLLALTNSRKKELLTQLKQQALKPIVDMAKWKSGGHFMPGYIMLGRIAGWSDQEIMDGASNRAVSIDRMLATISN